VVDRFLQQQKKGGRSPLILIGENYNYNDSLMLDSDYAPTIEFKSQVNILNTIFLYTVRMLTVKILMCLWLRA